MNGYHHHYHHLPPVTGCPLPTTPIPTAAVWLRREHHSPRRRPPHHLSPVACCPRPLPVSRRPHKHVSAHLRHLLVAECGCNDGAAFPFLYLALYLNLDKTMGELYKTGSSFCGCVRPSHLIGGKRVGLCRLHYRSDCPGHHVRCSYRLRLSPAYKVLRTQGFDRPTALCRIVRVVGLAYDWNNNITELRRPVGHILLWDGIRMGWVLQ